MRCLTRLGSWIRIELLRIRSEEQRLNSSHYRRRIWGKASRAVTSDNAGLAILGTTALVRAVSYAPWFVDTDRTPAHWLEGLLPAPAWSIVWLLIAVACMAAIITPRLLPVAVGLTVAINALWALSFIGITITGESPRG